MWKVLVQKFSSSHPLSNTLNIYDILGSYGGCNIMQSGSNAVMFQRNLQRVLEDGGGRLLGHGVGGCQTASYYIPEYSDCH